MKKLLALKAQYKTLTGSQSGFIRSCDCYLISMLSCDLQARTMQLVGVAKGVEQSLKVAVRLRRRRKRPKQGRRLRKVLRLVQRQGPGKVVCGSIHVIVM